MSDVTQTGSALVVVADVNGKIHVRVFDNTGSILVDASQPKNDHKKSWYVQLANLLTSNWDQSKLKLLEVKEIFRLCEIISRRYLTAAIIEKNKKLWTDDRVRNWMLGLFNNKCWYSEAQDSVSSIHVDHFRPKGCVSDDHTADMSDGYWWLAFNWKKYRIGGQLLNVKKSDVFPFTDLTRATHDDPPSLEKECPVLIDPLVEAEARLISYEWRDEENCVAVRSGDVTPEQALRVDRTIEILGLNRLPRLNEKRAQFWDKCKLAIADYKGANGPSCFAKIEQAKATATLKGMIKYEAEFSSVAEACVWKTAPKPLSSAVFAQ
ncbi:MAG: hypothetical protein JSS02_03005 [Planctomycetes bacterium]|nr:hypothetical protein [Planctomycetota bacterium]